MKKFDRLVMKVHAITKIICLSVVVLFIAVIFIGSTDYFQYEIMGYERSTNDYEIRYLPYTNTDNDLEMMYNFDNTTNPTYNELINFLKNDYTDTIPYSEDYVCVDYAVRIHNNAERLGIRTAVVILDFYEDNDGHALNAFLTTDRGLIFIDCTNSGIGNSDAIATIEVDETYHLEPLFESDYIYEDMGIVSNVEMYW